MLIFFQTSPFFFPARSYKPPLGVRLPRVVSRRLSQHQKSNARPALSWQQCPKMSGRRSVWKHRRLSRQRPSVTPEIYTFQTASGLISRPHQSTRNLGNCPTGTKVRISQGLNTKKRERVREISKVEVSILNIDSQKVNGIRQDLNCADRLERGTHSSWMRKLPNGTGPFDYNLQFRFYHISYSIGQIASDNRQKINKQSYSKLLPFVNPFLNISMASILGPQFTYRLNSFLNLISEFLNKQFYLFILQFFDLFNHFLVIW